MTQREVTSSLVPVKPKSTKIWALEIPVSEAAPTVQGTEEVRNKDNPCFVPWTFGVCASETGNSLPGNLVIFALTMSATHNNQIHLRHLPKVQTLLESRHAQALMADVPRSVVVDALRAEIDALRRLVLEGKAAPPFSEATLFDAIAKRLHKKDLRRLQKVINATGIVIHTNMGRAPMADAVVQAVLAVAGNYSNLELDLATGKRGGRGGQIEELLQTLTGAEAALVVNNNAAAVLLALSAVAAGGEVIISRGEMVEIGGGFRVPDVIVQCGGKLIEVGTTNKTRLSDYANAITPNTKVLLKVHASNYKIIGFTAETSVAELAHLGKERGLLVMNDLGSGALVDMTCFGLPYEPTVQETIKAGADIATVSGDKLLGGPQCGIILGKAEPIGRIAASPLFRALRADKMTLAALEATLRLYLNEARLTDVVPVLGMLAQTKDTLTKRARRLRNALAKLPGLTAFLADGVGYTGGGALPTVPLPTTLVQVHADGMTADALASALRGADPPVMGMVTAGVLALDVRTVRDNEFPLIVRAMKSLIESLSGG
jgi:L-seryl-tRNA(Ser) seleniumtransferase